jgi:hypothetical protein
MEANLWQYVVMALLVESVWQNLKMIWESGKFSVDKLGILLASVALCIFAKLDIFVAIGLPLDVPYVGFVCTGVLCSRGANGVHELIKKIRDIIQGVIEAIRAKA